MSRYLPHDVAFTIHRVQEAGRYLDNLAENVVDQGTADHVRAHANAVWDAAHAIETAARLLLLREVVIHGTPGVES